MSERNGDRARFQKNRKRKLLHRQRIQALMKALRTRLETSVGQANETGTAAAADDVSVLSVV